MKPIIVALISGVICFSIIILCFRVFAIRNRAFMMIWIFMLVLPILFFLHKTIPSSFYFSSRGEPFFHAWTELFLAIFLYSAGFFGGILQLYNLADRGFSLRILIDIQESANGSMTLDNVMFGYSGGRGIGWMYEKRLEDMLARGLIRLDGDKVTITSRGNFIATVYEKLQSYINFSDYH